MMKNMTEEKNKEPLLRISIPLASDAQRFRGLKTTPTKLRTRMTVVCTDDCENCIMFKLGCAKRCTRFPDIVCEQCPCRASAFAGKLTGYGGGEDDDERVQ